MSSNPEQPESSPSPEPDYPVAAPEPGQGSPELRVASLLLDAKPPEEKPPPEPRFQFSLGELFLLTFVAALLLSTVSAVPGGTVEKLATLAGLMGLGLVAGMAVMGLLELESAVVVHLWWAILVLYVVVSAATAATIVLIGR
jgi:hypothetical protein